MRVQRPKGTVDILPENSGSWEKVEETARNFLSVLIIVKSVRQVLKIMKCSPVQVVNLQMLFQKKCTILMIKVAVI